MSRTALSSSVVSRRVRTTCAPSSASRFAMARPIPRLAPVTMAVFPVSMVSFSLGPIDHERGHVVEKGSQNLLGFGRQSGFVQRVVYQLHPAVAGSLMDRERKMPRTQAGMAPLFDISFR